ncbi:MAG: glycosyltransferase family 4 protein [Bacteroidia bacterium]
MPKVLILAAHRPNRSPSQRYRFEQYIPFLETNGFQFIWAPLLNEKDDIVFYSNGNFFKKLLIVFRTIIKRRKDCRKLSEIDIVFIQRETHFLGISYFEKQIKRTKCKIIFDFDDAIWIPDTSPGNKKWSWLKKPDKFFTSVRLADKVIAGNRFLLKKTTGISRDAILIPTTIDTAIHKKIVNKPENNKVVIGWSGSLSTIKHFEMLIDVIKELKSKYKDRIEIKVLGDENYVNEELGIVGTAWSPENEVRELNSFDIGVMPLPNDEWAEGKCGLKALSYMACEVPVVASAVGANMDIVSNEEDGFLVLSNDEWINTISRLIENSALRKSIGLKGRHKVISKYSTEANKQKYLDAFVSCLTN